MKTKKPKVQRTGFRDFLRQQRQQQRDQPAPQFEITFYDSLSSDDTSSFNRDQKSDADTITIIAGQNSEETVIGNIPAAALAGCSRWFYKLFMTSVKDVWNDVSTRTIHLPFISGPVAEAIVNFAKMEHFINSSSSFLHHPPDDQNWASTADLDGRNRTIFQFEIPPDLALDICHAAFFLEIPALLDISCRMLGYYIDYVPSIEALNDHLIIQILSHVSPLKLALLEQQPEFSRFAGQMEETWARNCTKVIIDKKEMSSQKSWIRHSRFDINGDMYSHREIFITECLRQEIGKLSTDYKIEQQIVALSEEPKVATIPRLLTESECLDLKQKLLDHHRLVSDNQNSVHEDNQVAKESEEISIVGRLSSFAKHIPILSLSFPFSHQNISCLKYLVSLEITNCSIWPELPTAVSSLNLLRNVVLDSLIITAKQSLCIAIYNEMNDMRPFKQGEVMPNIPNDGHHRPPVHNTNVLFQDIDESFVTSSSVISLLKLLQVVSRLPSIESFQFSNPIWDGISAGWVWGFVLTPHWRLPPSPDSVDCFFPALKKLSFYGCNLPANSYSKILEDFSSSPITLLDVGANNLPITDPCIEWSSISNWTHLEHLFLSDNNIARTTDGRSLYSIAQNFPPSLVTLAMDNLRGTLNSNLNDFWLGLSDGGVFQLESLYLSNSGITSDILLSMSHSASNLFNNLRLLDLSNNRLHDSTIGPLEMVILRTPILSSLNLSQHAFTAFGMSRIAQFFLDYANDISLRLDDVKWL